MAVTPSRKGCLTNPHLLPFAGPQKVRGTFEPLTLAVKENGTPLHQLDVLFVVIVQSLNCVPLFATPWTAAHQASLSFTISQSLLKLMSVEFGLSLHYYSPSTRSVILTVGFGMASISMLPNPS